MADYTAFPSFTYLSAIAAGTGSITVTRPVSLGPGDIVFVAAQTQSEESCPTPTATGLTFAQAAEYHTTTTGAGSCRITLFWARIPASWTPVDFSIADAGDHVIAFACSVRNLPLTGDPWSALSGGSESTSDTSGSAPGVATTAGGAVMVFVARGNDSAATTHGSWANTSLSYLYELFDSGSTLGNGGGLALAVGPSPSTGTSNASTYTLSGAAQKAFISIALVGRVTSNLQLNADVVLPAISGPFVPFTALGNAFGNTCGFVDNNASGSGDICLLAKVRRTSGTLSSGVWLWWAAASTAASWTAVEMCGGTADNWYFGHLECATQGSDGKIHLCYTYGSDVVYFRLTPTYTSGHITGYTTDASFVVRAATTETRVEMREVVCQDASRRMMVCVAATIGTTDYVAHLGTMPLTATATGDIVGLDGSSTLSTVTIFSGTNPYHEHAAIFCQDTSNGDVFLSYGYVHTEQSAIPLNRRRLQYSGSTTWSIGSEIVETTESPNSMVSGMFSLASGGVLRTSVSGKEFHFDKLSGDTLTQDVFPILPIPFDTASAGNCVVGVNNAETECYVAAESYSGYSHLCAFVDGSWIIQLTQGNPAYASVLGIRGVAWSGGVAGTFCPDVNGSPLTLSDRVISLVRATSGNSGSGSIALVPFGSSGSGGVSISGVGSVALSAALVGSGSVAHLSSGTVAVSPLSVTATGNQSAGVSGAGAINLALALTGSGGSALSGSGSVAVGVALSGLGGSALTSSGTVALSVALSGSGTATCSGSGSVGLGQLTLSGTGAQASGAIGAGGIELAPIAVAGSGSSSYLGSGAVSVQALSLSGAGAGLCSGSGSVSISAPSPSGAGQGSYVGSGAVGLSAVSTAGIGTSSYLSSGALAVGSVAVAAVGSQAFGIVGSGSVALALALQGSGATSVSSSGSVSLALSLLASGLVSSPVLGSGSLTVPSLALAASGGCAYTSNGSLGVSGLGVLGSGLGELVASGSIYVGALALSSVGYISCQSAGALTFPSLQLVGSSAVEQLEIAASGAIELVPLSVRGAAWIGVLTPGSIRIDSVGCGYLTITRGPNMNGPSYINSTGRFRVECTDSEGRLYNPSVLRVAFCKGDGSKDVLTFGGSDPRDSRLTRESEGIYVVWYTYDVLGDWIVTGMWSDAIGDDSVTVKPSRSVYVLVIQDPGENYTDLSATPGES